MADLTFDNFDLTLYCRNFNQIGGFSSSIIDSFIVNSTLLNFRFVPVSCVVVIEPLLSVHVTSKQIIRNVNVISTTISWEFE